MRNVVVAVLAAVVSLLSGNTESKWIVSKGSTGVATITLLTSSSGTRAEWRFGPAFVGVTSSVALGPNHEVVELQRKRSSGLLTLRVTLTNQRSETILDGQHKYLIAYRPKA